MLKGGGKKVVKLFISTNDLYGSDNYTQEVVGEIDSVDNDKKNKNISTRFITATLVMQPISIQIVSTSTTPSTNRVITYRDKNWWQASPLNEDPIGQRVWISTPDAWQNESIGTWNEETRTLNVWLSSRGDYLGAKRIFVIR